MSKLQQYADSLNKKISKLEQSKYPTSSTDRIVRQTKIDLLSNELREVVTLLTPKAKKCRACKGRGTFEIHGGSGHSHEENCDVCRGKGSVSADVVHALMFNEN